MRPGILLLVLMACATPRPVIPSVEAYGRALEAGNLDEAWSLTADRYRQTTSREAFQARFSDPAVRVAHVQALRSSVRTVAPELLAEAATPVPPADAVRALAQAARGGRFQEAWRWLAAAERQRYTPDRLGRDFQSSPDVDLRLSRALEAVERPGESSGSETRWPLPSGGVLRVVLEDGQPRVAALE
jgi:hypothetical protein